MHPNGDAARVPGCAHTLATIVHDDFPPARHPIEIEWPPRVEPEAPRPRRRVDWRSVVGGTGRIFIALGMLLFGFVAYQLWGTGIQQARSQNELQDKFAQVLQQGGTATTVATSTTSAVSTSAGTTPSGTGSAVGAPPTVLDDTITASSSVSSAPRSLGPVKEGDPIARLIIPKIDVDQVVISGVKLADLEKGPGHYPDTPMPGEIGNAAIAGHRSTFGAPFARVDELDKGDEIDVTTFSGRFVYKVVDKVIVEPTEISVIADTPDAQLTLTSCWPKYSADKRIVIRAVLDTAASASKPAPASTSTSTPPTTVGAITPTTSAKADAVAATTTPTTAVVTPATRSADAFRKGWWSDDRAWGGVVTWGAALGAVALLAWRLSRRVHRNWVGALAGIGPFLVLLYFFYENVARLLPPNI